MYLSLARRAIPKICPFGKGVESNVQYSCLCSYCSHRTDKKKGANGIEAVNMKDGNDKISKRGRGPPNVIYRYVPGGSHQSIAKVLTVAAWDALVKVVCTCDLFS